MRHIHPFSASELGDAFDLDRAINYGLLPGIWFSDEPDEDLAGYVTLYLEQEIMQEGAFRHRILVCNEPRAREVDGIQILPWREFIDRLWTESIF